MKKKRSWAIALIAIVVLLTIYNILPTIFYYTKPLSQPVNEKRAENIATNILSRVDQLEIESKQWLNSFCKNLGIKKFSVSPYQNDSTLLEVTFKNSKDTSLFKQHLPRAGSLISFVPAQLSLAPQLSHDENKALVKRKVIGDIAPSNASDYFSYSKKEDNGQITEQYRSIISNRIAALAEGLGGISPQAIAVDHIASQSSQKKLTPEQEKEVSWLAKEIVNYEKTFGINSPITKRFYASLFLSSSRSKVDDFIQKLEKTRSYLITEVQKLRNAESSLKSEGKYLDSNQQKLLYFLESQKETLDSASFIVKKHTNLFESSLYPISQTTVVNDLKENKKTSHQTIALGNTNPFFKSIDVNWVKSVATLSYHNDVQKLINSVNSSETNALIKEKLNQLIINQVARVSQQTNEAISPSGENFYTIQLDSLTNSQSMLSFDLRVLAKKEVQQTLSRLKGLWNPQLLDFTSENFFIEDYATYKEIKNSSDFGIILYAPNMEARPLNPLFKNSSIYLIAKGFEPIIQKYAQHPDSPEALQFNEDFATLKNLLRQEGFQIGYTAKDLALPPDYDLDYIFENPDFYSEFIKSTREDFHIKGNKHFATLEFTDLEQRLLTINRIENEIHEELLKWKDDYRASKVDLDLHARYDVPPPVKNVYWENFKLSTKKYFRGDNRKILKWGLDLSGGKTVVIGLTDHHNQPVTNKADLTEGLNELTQRVNKLGLSEISPRIEGNHIVLDFPSSQNVSAEELIQASTMTFHVFNEQFTQKNPYLGDSVNLFLQEVWNEAVVTNRKDIQSINAIAWKHLGGDENSSETHPRTDHAKSLYESGLRLAPPTGKAGSSTFNDTLSQIAIYQGDDFTEWNGQSTPLIFVFYNYALEGVDLDNIKTGYDPAKGNVLSFSVKGSYTNRDSEKVNPRETLFAWSSQFSQEKIIGTPKEKMTNGQGWRMAVILNDKVISTPSLHSPLRDNVQVSGGFTQHEINKLAADLKAGSLSFKPQILSEENVSPDLGKWERQQGIIATIVGLLFVILLMIGYYRFAGVIASIAVIFNLLIMWGTLQNLQATLSLAGIAGIILTIGMAVDANVLVFERIREEYAISKRIASAVATGYRKAFSAIVDSNVTTIIAALILLNFDAGPIKGFAITLIIGILSSMFTALFMTKIFFMRWVKNPKNTVLNMANWVKIKSFDFLAKTKVAAAISIVIILIGITFLFMQKQTIFGLDFTGGYSFSIELNESENIKDYKGAVADAFLSNGASPGDFQINELNSKTSLRMQFGTSMEQKGHPFYGLTKSLENKPTTYSWETNPRITWVVDSLESQGLSITSSSINTLEKSWSEMSGQLSSTIRNNAIYGLGLALLFILIYITFRFEFKFALSAILCIIHDVLITLAIFAILHLCGVHVQINLQVIAALMTIIGYSLNDTIIVFDRIREDSKVMRKFSFSEVINHSLKVTLNRTVMTSLTTFVVLLTLIVLGGHQIFDFSLVMAIGVVFGTLSSLFIAPLLLLLFHNREEAKASKNLAWKKN